MKINNDNVRRRDRLLEHTAAAKLLRTGEYGVLSLASADGGAYGIPLNYVWDGADTIYIHCAPEGRKLREIGRDPKVSFCVVGRTQVLPGQFTTEYESVVAECRASFRLPEEERRRALRLIVAKYSPAFMDTGEKYIEKSFHRTEVIRLDILSCSGKTKSVMG